MLTGTLTQRMGLLVERGVFESEESLTTSAYRSLLMLQPALKVEIALSLYLAEEISLGRAAEVAGIPREQMKEALSARGIERKYPQRSREDINRDIALLLDRQ